MSDTGGSEVPLPQGPWRPLWWWYLLHGAFVGVWGAFALITPLRGPEGWVLDGIAYGVMLVLAGAQLVVQGLGWRRYSPGWSGVFLGGVLALLAATGVFIAGAMRSPDGIFWVIMVFLVIEGTVFIAFRGRMLRAWGLLTGSIVYGAIVILVVLRLTLDVGYDLIDPVFGALGVLYGMATITAAVQVRLAGIARDGSA